jgi:hypothetical protein
VLQLLAIYLFFNTIPLRVYETGVNLFQGFERQPQIPFPSVAMTIAFAIVGRRQILCLPKQSRLITRRKWNAGRW